MKQVKLGINIDHIATLRRAAQSNNPDTVEAARVVLASGADMVIMHLYSDLRHVQISDLERVRHEVSGIFHLNISPSLEMEKVALNILPDSVCLVPEKSNEMTEEGGLNLSVKNKEIEKIIKTLSDAGIETGIYCNPDPQSIRAAHNMGADTIELCTSKYSAVRGKKIQNQELEKLQLAAYLVKEMEMNLQAGGGLEYHNVAPIAAIENIDCVNVGFSVISRAVFTGLSSAVSDIRQIIS